MQSADIVAALRESALVYPIVMTGHLSGMALFGGMILMTDLRILGVALKSYPIAEVVNGLRMWKHLGLTLTAGCGFFLFWAKAASYFTNPYFFMKLLMFSLILIHAIVFRGSVYKKAAELDRATVLPSNAKLAAIMSIALWTGVVTFGRLIGYYEPPDKLNVVQVQAPVVAAHLR